MTLMEAENAARAEIKAGYARAYCTSYTPATGCRIHLESDQGWNPEPFWQERDTEPPAGGANDTLGDQ